MPTDSVMAVYARGSFQCLQYVLPDVMSRGSGTISNMSSIAGLRGSPSVAPSITLKHAIVGQTRAATIPLTHYGESIDVSNLALFLASDESAFMTGGQYPVDGGRAVG